MSVFHKETARVGHRSEYTGHAFAEHFSDIRRCGRHAGRIVGIVAMGPAWDGGGLARQRGESG